MAELFSRWRTEASNTVEDMYGTVMLGDDAGAADRLVVILQPPPLLFGRRSGFGNRMWNTLGLSFVNIQNRAYVQQVEEGSPADLQGVRRKDCVQYAAVLATEWQNPLTEDYDEISKQALERESTGQRISYADLKKILERGMDSSATGTFISPPSVPMTISVDRMGSSTKPQPQDLATPRPLVLVLRRTRQRDPPPSTGWSLSIWPRFRLDDECDVATKIIDALALDNSAEARGIRDKMQTCTGIAFLRSNKLTVGLSFHGGSGIVLSKLEDGSWSPPSAIGNWGMGVGLQVGVEVSHTLIILQTKEALEHFLRGASFQVGVGIGAAVANYGREAVGSASVSGALCGSTHLLDFSKEDEYEVDNIAAATAPVEFNNNKLINGITPMTAYAMSEGLYLGVSLDGNKLFTRHDINGRVYQFYQSGNKNNGKSSDTTITPQEILQGKVPVPPEAQKLIAALIATEFRHDVQGLPKLPPAPNNQWESSAPPITLSEEQSKMVERLQQFLFGGVAVTQLPSMANPRKRDWGRTLWLCSPGPGMSLELGFISKHSERKHRQGNNSYSKSNHHNGDTYSTTSEDLTLDSALMDNQSITNGAQLNGTGNGPTTRVELSRKHSVALTDVISVNQEFYGITKDYQDQIVCLTTNANKKLVFLTHSAEQATLLINGLYLLLEYETARLGARGGSGRKLPTNTALTARSPRKAKRNTPKNNINQIIENGYSSSEDEFNDEEEDEEEQLAKLNSLPVGWTSWSRIPGRSYLKKQASLNSDEACPKYVHGQLLARDICKTVHLPLALPMCRVLLLDSSSPVITQWEQEGGDSNFEKTPWTFPPATPREMDQYQSEHQLIASGSMINAHRTISYERRRNGQTVRLTETNIVDSDDSEKLAFTVSERMPRRGFSVKVKVVVQASNDECTATVISELRPVGKNMSNPSAVHKAFLLVLEELEGRYGTVEGGLLARFLSVVASLPKDSLKPQASKKESPKNHAEEKKETDSGVVALEDMLKSTISNDALNRVDKSSSMNEKRPTELKKGSKRASASKNLPTVADEPMETAANAPVMIEVKPLPKIRLSLMPSPREEDEDREAKKQERKKEKKKKSKSWSKKKKEKK